MTRTQVINRAVEADMMADVDVYVDERALALAEQEMNDRAIEEELIAWLSDPANRDDEEYSDVFKDVYGFRPRW